MNPLLVLALATVATAQLKFTKTGTGNSKSGNNNNPDKKFFQLPLVDENTSNLLWGGALGVGATLIGQELLGNNNNGNNGCGGFGRRRRQAEDEPNKKIFGLFGNNNNNCNPGYQQPNNPCGRKKRQIKGDDTGEKVDTKFFGNLFGNSNCGNGGNYNQPQGYQPSGGNNGYQNGYNQGFTNGFQNGAASNTGSGGHNTGSGGYNTGSGGHNTGSSGYNTGSNSGFNNNRVCQCSNLSKQDSYGREEARCQKPDHTRRKWCYSTSSSNCNDAKRSSKYPNNPWSYEACSGNNGSGARFIE